MDRTGLGIGQTLQYVRMLRPAKVMLINSKPFNGNEQHPEWYEGFSVHNVVGFPTIRDINLFLNGLTSVLSAETWYSMYFVTYAKAKRVKTFLAPNVEFSDIFAQKLGYTVSRNVEPDPTQYLFPSHWYEEGWMTHFPNTVYMPVPVFPSDFKKARDTNLSRSGKRRFVHIVGKQASSDRSGYESILDALEHSKADFELIIRCQHDLVNKTSDSRVMYDLRDLPDQNDLYADADAMIMPRRYGGNNMPMSEALISGLPVIMTDISPNNSVLPNEWLVKSTIVGQLQTRLLLNVYGAEPKALAEKIDWLATMPQDQLRSIKMDAFELGYDNFSTDILKPKYEEILGG